MKRKAEKRDKECPQCEAVRYGAQMMCSITRTETPWRMEGGIPTRTVSGGMCKRFEEATQ